MIIWIRSCKGKGYVKETIKKKVEVPQYTDHNDVLKYPEQGNQTIYDKSKGQDGDLKIKVQVEKDAHYRREGLNIISKHYVTVSDALLGCDVKVYTVKGPESFRLNSGLAR